MNRVCLVLNGIDHVPKHAAPIVDELRSLLELATYKTKKYARRGRVVGMVCRSTEKVRVSSHTIL